MKSTLLSLVFISFAASGTFAQHKLTEDKPFQKKMEFKEDVSINVAVNQYLTKQGLDSNNSFAAKKATIDETGMVHQRNQQFYKGIKVEYGTLITHSKNGKVTLINSELYDASQVNLTPSFSKQEGLNKAMQQIQAVKYLWDDEQQSAIVEYKKPEGELVIYPLVRTGEVKLAYKYDIYTVEPLARDEVYVDAHTGIIIFKNPTIKHATNKIPSVNEFETFDALVTGNANTKYSGARAIETRFDTPLNMYVLNDVARPNPIVTYNCERIPASYQNVHFKDNDNNWTTAEHANSFFDNAAQDAHWGAEMTYDFWKNNFDRNGFDDNNALIRNYVHYRQTTVSLSNAYWNGTFMTYGDGASKPFTSIDICGHEIGHAVCTYTAGLAYQNQSGAMNEGFSDIWGACIEHYGRTGSLAGTPATAVWRIGEDVTISGLRYMAAPTTLGDPDTFRGTNYVATGDDGPCTPTGGNNGNDYCGVHTNSGVMNHWFYILTVGKSGTNNAPVGERDTYNVAGIGMAKSSKIAYYAERDYLTPNSTFLDARDATIAIANNLYCTSGPEVVSVTNAWMAVNIGNAYVGIPNDLNLQSIAASDSVNCGVTSVSPNITFQNLGTSPITSVNIAYNIDGQANTNIVWTGNVATCSTGTQQITVNTAALSPGTHLLNITASVTGDANISNNTKSSYIFVNQADTVGHVNGFESPADNLITYNEAVSSTSLWQRGMINKANLTSATADNSNVYATGLTDLPLSNTKSYLTSRCYNLSQVSDPVLKFNMAFDLQYASDILYMQYSTNGGNTWSLLGTSSDPNWYTENTNCELCVGGEWTGDAASTNVSGTTNGTKRLYSYNLATFGSASSSPQSNMLFRFVFESDDFDNYDGAFIDNFVIQSASLDNQEFTTNSISIYPNPSKSLLNYSISNGFTISGIVINDISGKEIYRSSASVGNSIDVSNLSSGIYFVTFKSDSNSVTKKFIKD